MPRNTPAPPPPESPAVYMTPLLSKRKDGVFPSLLDLSDPSRTTKPNGGLNKAYRTNAKLLLQLRGKNNNEVNSDGEELQALKDAIDETILEIMEDSDDVVDVKFQSAGCCWTMYFNDDMNDAHENFCVEIVLLANEIAGTLNYVADVMLQPLVEVDPDPLAPPLRGFREAKGAFESIALAIRKCIVRLEFPEFPEGCKGRAFREVYQLNARLKSGSFATVCRGTHRATGRKVAIKCVLRKDLPPADDAAIYDEVAILSSLNHPHIVPLIDFFDEKDCYFIVMELMSGGDLFDRIGKKKSYSEADARDLVVKMLKSVAYCHQRKIAHCDMKPKNLLLMSEENDSFIKLADFGFAARVHAPKTLTKQCGTPFFVAPEILMRKPYDHQSDMWSVGCIIFLLLSGNLPFMGRSQKELFRKIVAGKFEFSGDDWANVSDDAKDLVRRMLVLDPDERITSAEAIRHSWLKTSRDRLNLVSLEGTSQRLKTFNARMKLRSAMIAIDWVHSIQRVSWISKRGLNTGLNGKSPSPSPKVTNNRKSIKSDVSNDMSKLSIKTKEKKKHTLEI
ncbi:calcium/calmodulin-dependent serine protein kinase [Fistulifera solaris]|uniref:Calcium/calmodulin-dependent serine protein kinase n=1 Tax=Fistulifera solaris TaxID=1519565 RepID=A0A1Z5JD57_FISSO|nr:calcium/calmodulin-dependent serine protein kinase [Fistulifera solaris]|eukprot:GAX11935.1 calcium/calmodulin-dependent serine protein kinase [Fistulifera solaris]